MSEAPRETSMYERVLRGKDTEIERLQNNDRLMFETNVKLSLQVDKYREALESLPELIHDATNHSSCQNCTVENKMEYVHEFIADALKE